MPYKKKFYKKSIKKSIIKNSVIKKITDPTFHVILQKFGLLF